MCGTHAEGVLNMHLALLLLQPTRAWTWRRHLPTCLVKMVRRATRTAQASPWRASAGLLAPGAGAEAGVEEGPSEWLLGAAGSSDGGGGGGSGDAAGSAAVGRQLQHLLLHSSVFLIPCKQMA